MKTLLPILVLFSSATVSSAAGADYSVVERGPHHRVWATVTWQTNAAGRITARTNSYTELASGMHYQDPNSGQWIESQEVIEGFPGGAVARQGQHQVIFANDLATAGAIDMQTPDGKRLTSHVLGLSYFDAATGTNVLIAEVTNCLGKILPPNQVLYERAFDTLNASVRYTYTRGEFEQDIILLEAPAPPDAYGLNSATTRLVVMTEFINPPQPTLQQSVVKDSAGMTLEDDTLDFGAMQITAGRGFLLGPSASGAGLRIFRQWATLEGRRFLLEQVRAVDLFKAINSLTSKQGASLKSPTEAIRFTASTRQLPIPKPGKADSQAMQLTSGRLPQKGYVLDYITVVSTNNFTFQNDTTYYVSGSVNLSGTTIFEGGTVIKFAPTNNASLNPATTLCRGSMYRPTIFTARDDDTVGQAITGSTSNPTTNFYARAMLALGDNSPLSYLRMSYATKAVEINGGASQYSLSHAQLKNCQLALNILNDDDNVFALNNVLLCNIANLGNAGNFSYSGAHLTCDHVTNQTSGGCYFANSLFAATSGFSGGVSNAYFGSGAGIFQTVGAGSYYLADNSPYRNAGTTNIASGLLADLKKRTTYPPIVLTNNITTDTILGPQAQRDTDIPDLGYHYDPLDYVVGGITVATNTLVLTNGVALGAYRKSANPAYGIGIGGKLLSGGLADQLNHIAYYNTVQEQSTTNWASTSVGQSVYLQGASASAQCRFTGWSIPGGSGDHFSSTQSGVPTASFQHCQFSGGTFTADQVSVGLTNCLWERVGLYWTDDDYYPYCYLQNNLFRGGSFGYQMNHFGEGTTGVAYDNLFDRTAISNGGGVFTNGYNGYVTNYTKLSSSKGGDVILTNNPVYQTSYLGNYYYPTNDGMLSTLIDVGGRCATNVGLYHFTTQTNQLQETNSVVDIGFHYVAIDPSTGQPYDTDGDGIPDYLEDSNGDGVYGAGDLSDWKNYNSPNGLTAGSGLLVFTPLK